MRKLRLLSLSLLAIAFIVSCTKEGPEGPVGASGAQGPPGSVGPQGPIGPAGPAGASATYSAWLPSPTTFGVAGWFDSTFTTIGLASRANFAAPSMTQAIMNQGVTLMYHTFAAAPALPTASANVQPIPFLAGIGGGNFVTVNYRPAVGRVIVYLQNVLPSTGGFGLLAGHFFRYVLLPGNISGGRVTSGVAAGYTVDELQKMPYEEVLRKFKIPFNGSNE